MRTIDPDLLGLDEDAKALKSVIQKTNRLPDSFPTDQALALCDAAMDVARAHISTRHILLQALKEQLAIVRKTIPREIDLLTGEPEYQKLRYALSELTSEAAARLLDIYEEELNKPSDPRVDPKASEVAEMRSTAAELINSEPPVINDITKARVENKAVEYSLIKLVFSAKASAKIGDVSVQNPETPSSRIGAIGEVLGMFDCLSTSSLRTIGKSLSFFGDALPHFATLAHNLGALCIAYAGDLRQRHDSKVAGLEPLTASDLLNLLESLLRRDETSRALKISEDLKKHPDREIALRDFKLDLRRSEVSDLLPISALDGIHSLDLTGTRVSNLAPLNNLSSLVSLGLSESRVKDLSPIKNLESLEILHLSSTQVRDITPLGKLTRLRILNLADTLVLDLSPLKDLGSLDTLIAPGPVEAKGSDRKLTIYGN